LNEVTNKLKIIQGIFIYLQSNYYKMYRVYFKIALTTRSTYFHVEESWSINDFLSMSRQFIREHFQLREEFELVLMNQHIEENIPAEEGPALVSSTDKFIERFHRELHNNDNNNFIGFYIRIIHQGNVPSSP